MQATNKPEMQDRVMSLETSGATAMTPLSLTLAGPNSDWVDIRTLYIFGSVISLLIGIAAIFLPAIMDLENNHRRPKNEIKTWIPTTATSPK